MATIQLGKIKQVWRGTYDSSNTYAVDDLVAYTDSGITSTYIAVAASSGTNQQVPSTSGTANSSYWEYVAKGVTDPIPTQTNNAGKFLKTNGTSLSFAEAGGWVKTGGGTGPSSAVTQIALDNIFSTDYKFYKVFIKWTQDDWMKIRFIDTSGSELSSSNYRWVFVAVHENNDGGPDREGYNGQNYIPGTWWNATDSGFCLVELTFVDPYNSNFRPGCSTIANFDDNNQLHSQYGSGYWYNTTGIRGFNLSGSAGDTIADSNFEYLVLGAKNT